MTPHSHDDWLARQAAARGLGAGPNNAATTRRLVQLARDPELEVRKVALESLGKLTPTARRVDALLGALDDAEWEVRWAAVRGLGAAAPGSARARRALVRAADDPDPSVAARARDALSSGGR